MIRRPTRSAWSTAQVSPLRQRKSLVAEVAPIQLSALEAYRTSATSWFGAPYGAATWDEPGVGPMSQVIDIDIPTGTAPVNGWPVLVYFHANGADRIVGGASNMGTLVKAPALAAGIAFVSVEFRHPVTNVGEGAPHDDIGKALQYIRALHAALNLDRTKFYGVCRSRGNLAIWQSMQPDMANGSAPTYVARQSSRLQGIWGMNSQIAYSVQRFCDLYVLPADHAAVLAENPDNPAWKNAIDDVPTADVLPQIAMVHDSPYFNRLLSKAELDAWDALPDKAVVHYPDAGPKMRDAYAARGQAQKFALYDDETDNAEQHADVVQWVLYLIDGMDAAEAMAMARARRRGAQAHYMRDDKSGAYVNHDGTGGAPTLGGQVGSLVCGQYGLANRTAGTPLGYGMGQATVLNRPLLTTLASGRLGLVFDSTDRMTVQMPSDGAVTVYGFTDAGEVTTLVQVDTTRYTVGTTAYDGKKMALCVGADTAPTANDMKVYRRFASIWAGRAFP